MNNTYLLKNLSVGTPLAPLIPTPCKDVLISLLPGNVPGVFEK